jgi:hypothetical protein
MKLLKLVDVFKVMNILKALEMKKEIKAVLLIFFYLLLVFIYVHFFACLMWFTLRQAKQLAFVQPIWAFAYEFGGLRGGSVFNPRSQFQKFDEEYDVAYPLKGQTFWSVMHQYLVCLEFSGLGLALVTNNPLTTMQAILDSLLIFISAFFMAWLFGEFMT